MQQIFKKVNGCHYDVILATETNWTEDIKSEEAFGSRFNVFRSDRDLQLTVKESGGGVLIAVNATLPSELLPTDKHAEFEDVWVKVLMKNEKHLFVSAYFPPDMAKKASYEKFFKTAQLIIECLEPETKIHVYDDFNQNTIDFIQAVDKEYLLQPVSRRK